MAENPKAAVLYRMVMPGRTCPSGVKSMALLNESGFSVEDRHLATPSDVDAFLAQHDVQTTPQTFIDGTRVGGFEALSEHLGVAAEPKTGKTYRPVIALFSVAALLAAAVASLAAESLFTVRTVEWFIAISMVLLGLQKLQDVTKFAAMFKNYDLLAQRWPGYGHIYPFIETGAGLLMIAGVLTLISAPLALVAASIGAFSVYKAVYIDKRELVCACVGGDSKVPLGFVSLTENLMMIGMALWMLYQFFGN